MGDEELEVFKISFTWARVSQDQEREEVGARTVVAPRASEELLDVGMTALLFAHIEIRGFLD
jgi:hypothetical protein